MVGGKQQAKGEETRIATYENKRHSKTTREDRPVVAAAVEEQVTLQVLKPAQP
jgi:hypothetical protein